MSAAGPSTGSGTAPGWRSGRDGGDGERKDGEGKDGEGKDGEGGDGLEVMAVLRGGPFDRLRDRARAAVRADRE